MRPLLIMFGCFALFISVIVFLAINITFFSVQVEQDDIVAEFRAKAQEIKAPTVPSVLQIQRYEEMIIEHIEREEQCSSCHEFRSIKEEVSTI